MKIEKTAAFSNILLKENRLIFSFCEKGGGEEDGYETCGQESRDEKADGQEGEEEIADGTGGGARGNNLAPMPQAY